MSLAYSTYFKGQNAGISATITSDTITAATGNLIDVVASYGNNTQSTAWTVSNTGTAITWTKQQETNITDTSKIVRWSGIVGATPPTTISVQSTAGDGITSTKSLTVIVHSGQHATTPEPSGNFFTGTGELEAIRSITPTSVGSCLWIHVADWMALNNLVAGTNCIQIATPFNEIYELTAITVRPIIQPRTNASPFILDVNAGTGAVLTYVAWEVQAAPPTIYRPNSDITDTGWTNSTGSDSWALLDETSPSDSDYIVSPTLDTTTNIVMGLDSTMSAGTYSIKLRARFSITSGQYRVILLNNSNEVQGTSVWQPVNFTYGTYTIPVTITGNATRIKIEVKA
jgi:hypothetical protein